MTQRVLLFGGDQSDNGNLFLWGDSASGDDFLLWGDVGTIAATAPSVGRGPGVGAGAGHRQPWVDYEKRKRIAAQLQSIYEEITAVASEPIAEEAAAVVAEYTPTSAPDVPSANVIDWLEIVEDGMARVAVVRQELQRIRDIALPPAIANDDEEAVAVLLMAS